MGYKTPNIDRIAKEGIELTDHYGQQSCTAGRAAFITGQNPIRTGLTKIGLPDSDLGLQVKDPTIAELLKPLVCANDTTTVGMPGMDRHKKAVSETTPLPPFHAGPMLDIGTDRRSMRIHANPTSQTWPQVAGRSRRRLVVARRPE
jgi:Sulfatase